MHRSHGLVTTNDGRRLPGFRRASGDPTRCGECAWGNEVAECVGGRTSSLLGDVMRANGGGGLRTRSESWLEQYAGAR